MNILRNIIAAILTTVTTTVAADSYAYLTIAQTGGSTDVSVSSIKKITFDENNIVLNMTDGSQNKLPLANVTKMFFSESSSGIETVEGKSAFSLKDGVLCVKGLQGSHIAIYDMSGKIVRTATLNQAETEINVSGMQQGAYIVKVGDQTKKIINK